MLYIITIIAAIESTVIVWLAVSYSPKKKPTKPNYSAHVDYLLSP